MEVLELNNCKNSEFHLVSPHFYLMNGSFDHKKTSAKLTDVSHKVFYNL